MEITNDPRFFQDGFGPWFGNRVPHRGMFEKGESHQANNQEHYISIIFNNMTWHMFLEAARIYITHIIYALGFCHWGFGDWVVAWNPRNPQAAQAARTTF